MNIRSKQQILIFMLLLVADQLSKWWIEQQYTFFHQVVVEGFFSFIKTHNPGVAFAIFADWDHVWRTNVLVLLTLLIALVVLFWWFREQQKDDGDSWLLMLILVGAVGNIWDRIALGYVVDFIDWYVVWEGQAYHWPAFNIADICISVAVTLLLLRSFKKS